MLQSMLPEGVERIMDVGCGPLAANYPWAAKARRITCIDWKLTITGQLPLHVEYIEGDFTSLDLPVSAYDAIIAADVFEHIPLDREATFVNRCVTCLKPGGRLLLSVPHKGKFAFLDPYQIKPALHRTFVQIYKDATAYNGCCDVHKGHKHYDVNELAVTFRPLVMMQAIYFGYLVDPLIAWTTALSKHVGINERPKWLQRAHQKELERDYGDRSFNVAVCFVKPLFN